MLNLFFYFVDYKAFPYHNNPLYFCSQLTLCFITYKTTYCHLNTPFYFKYDYFSIKKCTTYKAQPLNIVFHLQALIHCKPHYGCPSYTNHLNLTHTKLLLLLNNQTIVLNNHQYPYTLQHYCCFTFKGHTSL
jgi:hypothetical protein